MLADRVMCAVPNPGPVDVGSTITLGAAPTGYRSYLAAFGGGKPAYFVLSDGASRTITGVWTVNAAVPETATITRIIGNDRTGDTSGEIFAGDCVAWNEVPAAEVVALSTFQRLQDMCIGMTFEHNSDTLPPAFLWEDGANHSRVTYAKLFAKIGTKFGAGDGVNTFGVPDGRGRVAIGRSNMGGTTSGRMTVIDGNTLGAAGGSEWLQTHGHGINDPGHSHGVPGAMRDVNATGSNYIALGNNFAPFFGTPTTGNTTGISVQNNGGGNSQNVQPGIIKNKIIFTGVFP